jgi:GDP-4-dehydro-6-deoxy-D-mannose reductase
MRVLVTGSSGFVGSHLCRYLGSVGDQAIAFPGPDGPGALDVTDGSAVRDRVADSSPDALVHLAGISSVAWSHANPARTFLVNTLGTVNVLEAVRQAAPRCRVLVVGSGEMYGRLAEGRRAQEDDPLRPVSPYAASKCAAEQVARQFASAYGVYVICARPFNHLGPGQSPQFVVPSFARQIAEIKRGLRPPHIDVGDLSPVRDFLHVEDVVRGYRLLLDRAPSAAAYNVCSEKPLSIRDLLESLLTLSGVQAQINIDPNRLRPAEIPWLVGDASRIRDLGWTPRRTVQEALTAVLDEAFAR